MWGICICFLYLSYGVPAGKWVSAGRHMWGHLYLFFVFVIWGSSGELGFSWPVYVVAFVLVFCICLLRLQRGRGYQLAAICGGFFVFLFLFHLGRDGVSGCLLAGLLVAHCFCTLLLFTGTATVYVADAR